MADIGFIGEHETLNMRHLNRLLLGLGLVLPALFAAGCSGDQASGEKARGATGQRGGMPPTPVLAAEAKRTDLPVFIEAIGVAEAYASVSVKSLVGGQLMKVHFKEGQDIKRGDLLFSIDDRQYLAALHQAEANLARNQIQAKNAESNRQRYSSMMKQNAAAKSEYDEARTTAESLGAQVMADKAAVETAQLLLDHCSIKSPVDGRAGDLKVNEGNVVKANDIELVTINQIEPIYVSFAVPETRITEIRQYHSTENRLKVQALVPGRESTPEIGELSFTDNRVDSDTGTIRLKATFENKNHILWPGQFVNVRLQLTTNAGAIVVPSEAVQTGQDGQYVYVIKDNQEIEYRLVKTGMAAGEQMVIAEGLKDGEQVVTDGHLRLTPGDKVSIKTGLMPERAPEKAESKMAKVVK